jgi:hypothetical protein
MKMCGVITRIEATVALAPDHWSPAFRFVARLPGDDQTYVLNEDGRVVLSLQPEQLAEFDAAVSTGCQA